jgi:hypothetical protein
LFDSSSRPTELLEASRRLYYRSDRGDNGCGTEVIDIAVEVTIGSLLWAIARAGNCQHSTIKISEVTTYM